MKVTKLVTKALGTKSISVVILFLLLVLNCIFTENFISSVTLTNLITQSTKVVLLGLGMTLVISTGGIDISVGSAMGLAATISALFLQAGHPEGILLSLLIVLCFGLLAGYFVTKFDILPMVVTLALFYVMRGMAKGISSKGTVAYHLPKLTNFFINPLFGALPVHFFIILIASAIMYVLVNKMKFGSYTELYGNNPIAARICGIDTKRVVLLCYVISAFFAWCSGMTEMIMVSSADPSKIGLDLELDAIAAVLIGGTPITGGYPNILGTVSGAFLLQLITMMCNMHNIPYSYSLMIKAGIILFALSFNRFASEKV